MLAIVDSPSLSVENKLLLSARRTPENEDVESEEGVESEEDVDSETESSSDDTEDEGKEQKKGKGGRTYVFFSFNSFWN